MIDFTIPKRTLEENLYSANRLAVTIPDQEWAPAVWDGTEGLALFFTGTQWTVDRVDLINRTVFLKRSGA